MSIVRVTSGILMIAAIGLVTACGGGGVGGGGGYGSSTVVSSGGGGAAAAVNGPPQLGYTVTYLTADNSTVAAAFGANTTDSNLVNPWGIAFAPTGDVWVANEGSSTTTLYDGAGLASPAETGGPSAISIVPGSSHHAGPTGVIYNSSISAGSGSFVLPGGGPAQFIYGTLGGTIEGWDVTTDANTAITFDGTSSGAAYTGLALGQDGNGNYFLYAADFANSRVDVFDHGFTMINPPGAFSTPAGVPSGYVPYGIQNIPSANGSARLYVTYAQQNANRTAAVIGSGNGYVAVFDYMGNLVHQLISGGALNAPWGVALAPSGFGNFGGALLVGNFGDGKINAYDASTGTLMGSLTGPSGSPLQISDLWGIAFGNGANNQPATTLFFAAGTDGQVDGVYGRIDYGTYATTTIGGGGGGGGGYGY